MKPTRRLILGSLLAAGLPVARASEPIRIGVVGQFSGMFSDLGNKMTEGFNLYLKVHGDSVAGRKVELISKDVGGPAPDVARRLTQELVVRDKVDLLTGYIATPDAMGGLPVAAQAKKPMIVVQAATGGLTAKSPYAARLSYTLGQVSGPLGEWAAKNGIKTVFTLVSDYGPGYDSEKAFVASFTKGGGQIIGNAKVPLGNLDFGPFAQRARDAKPDAVFVFVPAGQTAAAFMKAFAERELSKAGIRLITTGDVVGDSTIDAVGEAALGVISSHHYSAAHDSPENQAFIKAYHDMYGPNARPDFISMQAYDTLATIFEIGKRLNGNLDADKFMAELRGFKLNSPRGPIMIHPETRDVAQNIYIRRVEKRGNRFYNIEFDKLVSSGTE